MAKGVRQREETKGHGRGQCSKGRASCLSLFMEQLLFEGNDESNETAGTQHRARGGGAGGE